MSLYLQQSEYFYSLHNQTKSESACHVHKRETFDCHTELPSQRWSFYKITLITQGEGALYYGDQCFIVRPYTLLFLNPNIAYSWFPDSKEQTGYFCTFSADFLHSNRRNPLVYSRPFQVDNHPIYAITKESHALLEQLFEQALAEQLSNNPDTLSVIQNYVELIIYQGMKLAPQIEIGTLPSANKIAGLFMDLLEQQFSLGNHMLTPIDYATQLSIHVNHLNRWVKRATEKTTQQHINTRRILEAKSQLLQTDERISAIAYSLGFSHPSSFNHFFKKNQGLSPKAFRNMHA